VSAFSVNIKLLQTDKLSNLIPTCVTRPPKRVKLFSNFRLFQYPEKQSFGGHMWIELPIYWKCGHPHIFCTKTMPRIYKNNVRCIHDEWVDCTAWYTK